MKQNQVKIGGTYFANVTNKRCEIRIEAENRYGGWDATNLATGKKIRIKTAGRLTPAGKTKSAKKASEPAAKATAKAKSTKKTAAKQTEAKRLSALDAAAKVLAETKKPMTSQELITAMAEKNYWTSPGGKTPHATLYAAIVRELLTKGNESRFEKIERGKFALRG